MMQEQLLTLVHQYGKEQSPHDRAALISKITAEVCTLYITREQALQLADHALGLAECLSRAIENSNRR